MTEDCNLRCKYCFFSEIYDNTRNCTTKMMSEEVALRSLDYYFERMKEIQKVHPGKVATVTFYGGEPLMNFELIKKCVQYIKKNCPMKCLLNVTTNGLLLDDEKAEFLHDNDFFIAVSLDGNQENHDRNRVTPNGKESFDVVYKNIKAFQERYPQYEKIKLTCVFDYHTTLMENNDFFINETLPGFVFVNQVSDKGTDYYAKFDKTAIDRFKADFANVLKRFLNNKKEGKLPLEYADNIGEQGTSIVMTRLGSDDRKMPILPYTAACVPGMKISVTTDGMFQICEKMDCSKPIGSYRDGLNYTAIVKLLKEYNHTVTRDCGRCPLYRACSACFAITSTKEGFTKPNCTGMIEFFRSQLMLTYTALENNPNAYQSFAARIEWALNK